MKILNCLKKLFLILIALISMQAKAQDTTAMVKEFNKVMSFALQPYLYYSTVTKTEASPVIQAQDTGTVTGEFYKNGTSIYYSNNQEIIFLDDSLFIQINHERKSIWVSKVDAANKEKMNFLPLANKELQQMFRKKFTISKSITSGRSNRLSFVSKQTDITSAAFANIDLQYSGDKFLPEILEINVSIKQLVDSEAISHLERYGVNTARAVVAVDNKNFFIRNQKLSIRFDNIDNSMEKAGQIPTWKTVLNYNIAENSFSGKGVYSEYEITKTY